MRKKTKRLTAAILCSLLLLAYCSGFMQAYALTNISSTTTGISLFSISFAKLVQVCYNE